MGKKIVLSPQGTLSVIPNLGFSEPAHISRYLITARIIKQIMGSTKQIKVLDVGGKKGLLREFGIESTIIDMEAGEGKDYVQGDALNMPFKDESYDIVVSCDVLEHISRNDRKQFVSEMLRVAKGFVILCAPFDRPRIAEAEIEANEFYKKITNKDHRWLVEHISNGLPSTVELEKLLSDKKVFFKSFNHLSIQTWLLTTKIHLLHSTFGDVPAVIKLAKEAYENYYSSLCNYDFDETGYRTFYILNKNESVDIALPDRKDSLKSQLEYSQYISQDLITSLRSVAISLRNKTIPELKKRDNIIKNLEDENQSLREELAAIKSSSTYKIIHKLGGY